MDHVHHGVRPVLSQDYKNQLMKVIFTLHLRQAYPDLTQAKEAVEHGKFNVIVTTQLPIVLTLQIPTLIMYVMPAFITRILSLCRFDEFSCHLTQALCREATTNHLVRMVERGRLHDMKFPQSTPSDATAQQWIEDATRLDGTIPPPSIYIHPSTESPASPFINQRLRDTTTAAWLSPSNALIVALLILQERSKSGIGVPAQPTVRFSRRDETPRDVCQVDIPGFEDCNKIEEYGHSRLEALVSGCLSACRSLQTSGLLEPAHFPAIYPFVPVPRTADLQQSKKTKSNGVRTHPRRTPLFWSLSIETLRDSWYPTIVFVDGSAEEFGVLAILTRHPLPTISDFPLFITGNPLNVRLRKCRPGILSLYELEQLRRTTLRIMRFVGNKPLVCNLDQLPYLLFPLEPDTALLRTLHEPCWAPEGYPHLSSPCESGAVMNMAASAFLPIATESIEDVIKDLNNAVIQDRKIEYTKHYFVDKIREDLTPLHKPQEGEVRIAYISQSHPHPHFHSASMDTKVIWNIARPASRISRVSKTLTNHWCK